MCLDSTIPQTFKSEQGVTNEVVMYIIDLVEYSQGIVFGDKQSAERVL